MSWGFELRNIQNYIATEPVATSAISRLHRYAGPKTSINSVRKAPVNWPDGPRPPTERPTEVVRVQANASVNRMFIGACDRHGHERGVSWVQGSVIVDADGYPPAGPAEQGGEQMLLASLNLAEARNKRISERNDLHRDRRVELYG